MVEPPKDPRIVVVTHEREDPYCPKCSGLLVEVPEEAETSEESVVVDGERVLRKHVRKSYRCGCGIWVTAP